MIVDNSEFTNLTKAQVEGLRESFDFLRNGYQPVMDWQAKQIWVIRLRHQSNHHYISIWLKANSYAIFKDRKLAKMAHFRYSPERYRLLVGSDMSLKVIPSEGSASADLVSG